MGWREGRSKPGPVRGCPFTDTGAQRGEGPQRWVGRGKESGYGERHEERSGYLVASWRCDTVPPDGVEGAEVHLGAVVGLGSPS